MSEKHKPDATGLLQDGTRTEPVTREDIALYDQALQALRQWEVHVLLHARNAHEWFYIINFDGTGNDAINDHANIADVGLFPRALPQDLHIYVPRLLGETHRIARHNA